MRTIGYDTSHILEHHGVKGQKWGVRKQPRHILASTTNREGKKVEIVENHKGHLAKFMEKHNKTVREQQSKSTNAHIDVDGKKVGDLFLYRETPVSMNVNWISIVNKERGHGYAQAAMKSAIDYSKAEKMKQMTLEVPGESPDARHIYEKNGFKSHKQLSTDDTWGGLTSMKKKL